MASAPQKVDELRHDKEWTGTVLAALYCIILMAFSAAELANIVGRNGLAGDEIWGAMHANLGALESLFFTLIYDLHPPFYYLQLNAWSVFGKSDSWLLCNSLLWSVLAAALLYKRFRKSNSKLFLIAAATTMLCVPIMWEYSAELRMYSLLAFLALCLLLEAEKCLDSAIQDVALFLRYFLVAVLTIYSHTAGFLAVLGVGGLMLWRSMTERRQHLKRVFALHLILACTALPIATLGLLKSVSHTGEPTLGDFFNTFAQTTLGWNHDVFSVLASVCISLALAITLIHSRSSRSTFVFALLAPYVFCLVISVSLKPFWLPRVFIFTVPFLIALLIMHHESIPTRQKVATLWLVLAAGPLFIASTYTNSTEPHSDFRTLVTELTSPLARGDCVALDNSMGLFWAMTRYYNYPGVINVMEVQGSPGARMTNVLDKIPAQIRDFAGITPKSNIANIDGVEFRAGTNEINQQEAACNRSFLISADATFRGSLAVVSNSTTKRGDIYLYQNSPRLEDSGEASQR